jgi:precorrin-2 dehydrogenase/sirohydrochlorin ferrochelatase
VLPILLDVSDKLAVVVGGGAVGLRKARAARDAGAAVRVVDPAAVPDSSFMWVAEPYRIEHLDGASLVFAAATPDVNTYVVADARTRGLWVNAATDPERGDFALPSVVQRGGLTVAVGTGGASPALARRIREKLDAEFDAAFADWVDVLAELRSEVLAIPDEPRRRELLDALADWPWLARLRSEGVEAVRAAMRGVIDSPASES